MGFRKRELRGVLARLAWQTVRELMAAAVEEPHLRPGMVSVLQTFGDRIDPHPHVHALVVVLCSRSLGRSQGRRGPHHPLHDATAREPRAPAAAAGEPRGPPLPQGRRRRSGSAQPSASTPWSTSPASSRRYPRPAGTSSATMASTPMPPGASGGAISTLSSTPTRRSRSQRRLRPLPHCASAGRRRPPLPTDAGVVGRQDTVCVRLQIQDPRFRLDRRRIRRAVGTLPSQRGPREVAAGPPAPRAPTLQAGRPESNRLSLPQPLTCSWTQSGCCWRLPR